MNAGGRGTLRGVIRDEQGQIVASMAQEMLLRPVRRPSGGGPESKLRILSKGASPETEHGEERFID